MVLFGTTIRLSHLVSTRRISEVVALTWDQPRVVDVWYFEGGGGGNCCSKGSGGLEDGDHMEEGIRR